MNKSELLNLLNKQKMAFRKNPPSFEKRMESLKILSDLVRENKPLLIKAINEDFGGRAEEETRLLEIVPLQDQIRHSMRHLRNWMKPRSVTSSWFLIPAKAFYQYQPLGSVGIMGAWNYQILLTLGPLIDAIAAGNHAIIKPSEMAPASAEVIRKLINAAYPEEYIHCVTGDAEMAKDFSSLPFDHLFFTGSSSIGKKIMAAAAPNLTPVTLELGGKSPAVIHPSYPLKVALQRIINGKLFNAGQTCVAPDYIIVPKSLNDEIENTVKSIVNTLYPELRNEGKFTSIINEKHFQRLKALLEDAKNKGARILEISGGDENKLMTPKLLFNVNDEMQVMQEEIFGPILPVLKLETIEEAINYINDHHKPLALYYFDNNSKRIKHLLKFTQSGGVTVNDTIYHLAQHRLPFGGVGNSGMGHYHGFDGFKTFSKKRAVMKQGRIAASDFLQPPYTGLKQKLISWVEKISKV